MSTEAIIVKFYNKILYFILHTERYCFYEKYLNLTGFHKLVFTCPEEYLIVLTIDF